MTRTNPVPTDGGVVLTAKSEHSLRNHLAIILGFCEVMMQDAGISDQTRADLHEIHHAALAALATVTEHRT